MTGASVAMLPRNANDMILLDINTKCRYSVFSYYE